MTIYIRHAEKMYENGKADSYWLDPHLTENGIESAHQRFIYLLRDNPVPDLIICSPYLRTRQTAKIAQDVIFFKTKILIEISYDGELSEFLNCHKYKNLDGAHYPKTLKENPSTPETKYKFKKRVHQQFQSSLPRVWYITHGTNIQTIANYLKQPIKYPDLLGAIKIDQDNNVIQI